MLSTNGSRAQTQPAQPGRLEAMAEAVKGKGRTRAEQRAATLKLILDTSEELFSQLGYFGVTIKDIANKMGIHPALIHYYFENKMAIFDAVFARDKQKV